MSHLMRAQLGFLCGSREPKLLRVALKVRRAACVTKRPRSAGYDCVINATVREGRVWLPKQHYRLESPRSRGVGTPRVCRPADYLPSGTVGQWPSCHRAMVERTNEGAATQKPTSKRRNSRSNLGARERDPRTLASWRHWFFASCRGNCFQADTLRNGKSLVGFRNWTIGQWYGLISSCPFCMWLRGYGYSFSWSSSTGSSCSTQTPLASSEVEGRWQWPSLVAILCTAQHVRSG